MEVSRVDIPCTGITWRSGESHGVTCVFQSTCFAEEHVTELGPECACLKTSDLMMAVYEKKMRQMTKTETWQVIVKSRENIIISRNNHNDNGNSNDSDNINERSQNNITNNME